jgi:hypothetical protein
MPTTITNGIRPPKNSTADKLLDTRNKPVVIAGKAYGVSEMVYVTYPDAYSAVVTAIKESRNCLDALTAKYPKWMEPKIVYVSFVHFEEAVYLKTVYADGEVSLADTNFIAGRDAEDASYFSRLRSPDDNVDLLVNQFDPVSIITCFDLFTRAAAERISAEYAAEVAGNAVCAAAGSRKRKASRKGKEE